MDAHQILDEFKTLVNKDSDLQRIRYEVLCEEAYNLEVGHPELIDPQLNLGLRVGLAQQQCFKIISGGKFVVPQHIGRDARKIETVEDIQAILKDPSLAPEELAVILDATYYIHDANDALDPETISKELQSKYGTKRADGGIDNYSVRQVDNGDGTFKEVTSEEDLLAKRKERTELFLKAEHEQLSKQRFQEKTNTNNSLRQFETNIAGWRRNMVDDSENEEGHARYSKTRTKYFEMLGTNNDTVKTSLATGAGASLYLKPGKFMASSLGKRLIANGIMKSFVSGGLQAVFKTVLAGTLGPLAPIAAMLLNSVLGKYINKGLEAGALLVGGLAGAIFLAPIALGLILLAALGAIGAAMGAILATAILGGTVGVALILFIINSGGYLVPPVGDLSLSQANLCSDPTAKVTAFPPVAGSSCPVPKGFVSCGSYGEPGGACPAKCGSGANAVTGASGHGGNCYWAGQAPLAACNYAIPTIDTRPEPGGASGDTYCSHSTDTKSTCFKANSECTYYGYAADMTYSNLNQLKANACLPVYLPFLEGQSVTWTLGNRYHGFLADRGAYGILKTTFKGKVWELYMIHLNQEPLGGNSGDLAGTLFDVFNRPNRGDGRHVHTELRVDAQYYKPDFLCGGTTPRP